MTTADPNPLIASLVRDQVTVDLKTSDICFPRGLASFEQDLLIDLFEQVCDIVEPAADNPRKRATHAINTPRHEVYTINPATSGGVSTFRSREPE